MNPRKPLITFAPFEAARFIKALPQAEQKEVFTECDTAEAGFFSHSRFSPVPGSPGLWQLPISANGHNWCLLAFWDQRYVDKDYLIFTHGFAKVQGVIPPRELAKANQIRQDHFTVSKGVV